MQIKFIAILSFVLMAFYANAQTEKGSLMLGGSTSFGLGLSGIGDGASPSYQFNFNPNVGVFLVDNFVVGGTINTEFRGNEVFTGQTLGAGAFARYYFDTKNSKLKPFLHSSFGIDKYWSQSDLGNFQGATMNASLGGGLAYFINDNVSLEASVHYNYANSLTNSGRGGHGVNFNLGFQIYLGRNKKKE